MNHCADIVAGNAPWYNQKFDLHNNQRKYVTELNNLIIPDGIGNIYKKHMYDKYLEDWRKRQPVRSASMKLKRVISTTKRKICQPNLQDPHWNNLDKQTQEETQTVGTQHM